jgi:hypothetical protein
MQPNETVKEHASKITEKNERALKDRICMGTFDAGTMYDSVWPQLRKFN